jgi:chemotaxis protein CheD
MLVQMINTGARKFNLAARIYGGSSMFMDTGSISCFNIGEQNVEVAIKFLKDKEISVKSVETGGKKGRKVVFDTSAGVISSNVLTEKKR